MTIDEAIEQLKNLEKCEAYLWSKDIQAIDIAVKALEENQKLKADYERLQEEAKLIDINAANVQKEYEKEIKELKRLLKLAVDDFDYIYEEHSCLGMNGCRIDCPYCDDAADCCKGEWKHADEAIKLIGEDNE